MPVGARLAAVLTSGSRVGPYEIVAPLGAGGMGEVYRARDTKLEREVALKVLPGSLAQSPEALARFSREARAVAALSHPNILAIFDFGEEAGRSYAVMELLEGETLRERLLEGALTVRKTLEIAAQVAQGLAAAHERGIVHRDLKPDNLFITRDGRAKILDFGLAKLGEATGSHSQLMAAPTQNPGTEPGAVLGTVGYMAPEQVKGLPADARADLFALGVTIYEMLTGQRAFAKGSSIETMSAILKEEPPELDGLAAKIPPALDRVLRHCLEKNPEERFQSARDLAFALRDVSGASSSSVAARSAAPAQGARLRRWLPLAAAVLVGLGVGWLVGRRSVPASSSSKPLRPEFRQLTKQPGAEYAPALSPDGETLIYERDIEGQSDLFLQRVDGQTSILLTADCKEDDGEAAFSPDGKLIAYRSGCQGGGLFVMGATGENVRRVADFGFTPTWSPDGREIAVATSRANVPWNRPNESELWAIAVDSGAKRLISRGDALNPSWSPGGQRIAYWGLPADSFSRDLWTAAADGSEATVERAVRLTDDPHLDWNPVWSADGRSICFVSSRGGTLNFWRLAIDEKSGRPQGEPEPLTAPSGSAGWLSSARGGRRLAFVDRNARTTIFRAAIDSRSGNLAGSPELLYQGSIEAFDAGLSPDGDSLLISSTDIPQHLFLLKADGSSFRQLTEGPFRDRQGSWSPDGRWIAFQTSRYPGGLAMIRPDGGGLREVVQGVAQLGEPLFSPDGRSLAVFGSPGYLLDISGELPTEPKAVLAPTEGDAVFNPDSFSPDGRKLAGMLLKEGANSGVAIYSTAESRWEILRSPGVLFPLLLNNEGLMYWLNRGTIELLDGAGRLLRTVMESPPGHQIGYIGVSEDRRWLTWIDATDESDIWLMTLDDSKGGETDAATKPR